MNAAKIILPEFDASTNVAAVLKGIICVQGITKRGPINGVDTPMRSWPQFEALYGGLINTSDFPLYCKLMLDSGVILRPKRCVHMANIATAHLPVVSGPGVQCIPDSTPNALFNLPLKYAGADYNNIRIVIAAASNGVSTYFNLQINHLVDSNINELYENLTIIGNPTAVASTYLAKIAAQSEIVTVTYSDLSALSGARRPVNGTYAYSTGADGDAVTAADYTGASSDASGWFAFDGISDSITMMAPEMAIVTGGSGSNALVVGAVAYVEARKNMDYVASFDNSIISAANLVTAKSGLSLDSSFFHTYAGGIKWVNPVDNTIKQLLGNAHIAINMTQSDLNFGEHYSYAGLTRGVIASVVGPINNFANPSDLDTLANAQINVIIRKNNKTVIWGNITSKLADSKLSQISVRRYLNKFKLQITPLLEKYLEDPNDIQTWKALYNEAKVVLDADVNSGALNSYTWNGDQFAKSMADLVVNTTQNVALGKYKANLGLDIVTAIREITLGIYITPTGITIDEL